MTMLHSGRLIVAFVMMGSSMPDWILEAVNASAACSGSSPRRTLVSRRIRGEGSSPGLESFRHPKLMAPILNGGARFCQWGPLLRPQPHLDPQGVGGRLLPLPRAADQTIEVGEGI